MIRGMTSIGRLFLPLLLGTPWLFGETAKLELKTLPDESAYGSREFYLGMSSQQHFFMQSQKPAGEDGRFKEVVKKEPKYASDHPFRCVAKLGSYEYAFALDSTDLKKNGYDRLYLDLDRDGDLTDDEPIKAKRMDAMFGGNYRHREFPLRVLAAEAGGEKFDCPCSLSVGSNLNDEGVVEYASASWTTRAYREGSITLDGKSHAVFLIDYNNNGTFNDRFEMDKSARTYDDRFYPMTGDMVLVDPDFKTERFSGYGPTDTPDRQYLSKLVNVDGKYFKIEATPSGDKLTLEPSELPLGAVSNESGPFRAVLFGEHGLVKVAGDKDKPATVPAGEWSLLEYQVDLTDAPAEKPKPASAPAQEPAPANKKTLGQKLAALFGADNGSGPNVVFDNRPKYTLVRARARGEAKPLKVGKDKTEKLAFGPPYKPVVAVSYVNGKEAHLELKLVGVAGEVCETMMIKGSQPSQPSFRILKKNGDLVKKGQFEYG